MTTCSFCEEDYATTRYIAEFANAISNFAYGTSAWQSLTAIPSNPHTWSLSELTAAGYFALRHTGWRLGHMDQLSVSLFMVGLCSFLFHATLRQSTQFSDDVSMLFLTGALLQRIYCAGKPPSRARGITIAIYASVGTMSAIYIRSGNLLIHMSMFAAMLLLIGLRTMYLINKQAASGHEKTKCIRKFSSVCAYLAVAFLLWNVDFEWCHELRRLRASIGLPWAWLLELHAWWHVLTAVGAALHMDLVRELCP